MAELDQADPARSLGRQALGASYGWFLKLFLSATAITSALIAYGFFSESALMQMAGLPQLSADLFELAELGGRALLDSLASLNSGMQLWTLVPAVLVLALLCSLRDHWWLGPFLRVPWLLALAQLALLALLLVVVFALVKANTLSTAIGIERHQRDALVIKQQLRQHNPQWTPWMEQWAVERLTYDVWPPPLRCGTATGLGCGIGKPTIDDYGEIERLGFPLHQLEGSRQAARRTFAWLLTWVIVTLFAGYLLAYWRRWLIRDGLYLSWQQARSQPSNAGWREAIAGDRQRFAHWKPYLATCIALIEPLLVGLTMLAVVLLPSAYGALARGSVGMQQVTVHLQTTGTQRFASESRELSGCGSELAWSATLIAPATQGASDPSALQRSALGSGSDDRSGGVTQSSSTGEADAAEPDQAMALAGGDGERTRSASAAAPGLSSDPKNQRARSRACNRAELARLKAALDSLQQRWGEVARRSAAVEPEDYRTALHAYEEQLDRALDLAAGMACREAFRLVWLQAPKPAATRNQPDLAQAFWSSWNHQVDAHGTTRYGYLLTYPRGEFSDSIRLIEVASLDLEKHRINATIREIPRQCIASFELATDSRRARVNEALSVVQANPLSDRITDLAKYPSAYSLGKALRLLQLGYASEPRSGAIISSLGLMASAIDHHEANKSLVIAELLRQIETAADMAAPTIPADSPVCCPDSVDSVDPATMQATASADMGPQALRARAAATSLMLTRSPEAAIGVAELLHRRLALTADTDVATSELAYRRIQTALGPALPTLITASGFLANGLAQQLRDLPDAPECAEAASAMAALEGCRNRMKKALSTLVDLLAAVARDPEAPTDLRLASCTALGLAGDERAGLGIVGVVGNTLLETPPNWSLYSACIGHYPHRLTPERRQLLRDLVRGAVSLPDPASGGTRQLTEIPVRNRRQALSELYEAGLYHEDALFFELAMTSLDPLITDLLVYFDDVDGGRLGGRLMRCARDRSEETSRRERCLRLLPLLDPDEDGDSPLPDSGSMAAPASLADGLANLLDRRLANSADGQRLNTLACEALAEFRLRDGVLAALALESRTQCAEQLLAAELAPRDTRLRRAATLQTLAGAGLSASLDFDPGLRPQGPCPGSIADFQRRVANQTGTDLSEITGELLMLLSCDLDKLPASLRGIVLADGTVKLPEDAAATSAIRRLAFEALIQQDTAANADLSLTLLQKEFQFPSLVAVSAQFLENQPFAATAPALLDCAENPQNTPSLRLRCTLALPLLEEDVIGEAGFLARLQALDPTAALSSESAASATTIDASRLRKAADRARAEYVARGASSISLANADIATVAEIVNQNEAPIRWLGHLLALSEALRQEPAAKDTPGELQTLDEFIEQARLRKRLFEMRQRGGGISEIGGNS